MIAFQSTYIYCENILLSKSLCQNSLLNSPSMPSISIMCQLYTSTFTCFETATLCNQKLIFQNQSHSSKQFYSLMLLFPLRHRFSFRSAYLVIFRWQNCCWKGTKKFLVFRISNSGGLKEVISVRFTFLSSKVFLLGFAMFVDFWTYVFAQERADREIDGKFPMFLQLLLWLFAMLSAKLSWMS